MDSLFGPSWLSFAAGGAVALVTVMGGWLALRRQSLAEPEPSAPPAPAEPVPEHDPFIFGSKEELRTAARRRGSEVTVRITDATGKAVPWEGKVLDRSVGGLRLMMPQPVPVGAVLAVRTDNASPLIPWVPVEVRNCRSTGTAWEVGCRFVKVPPSSVLWQFG